MDTISTDMQDTYFNKPSLNLRVKAMLIDTLVLIALMYLASVLLNALNIKSGNTRAIILAFILLYEPIFISFGASIGQRIMGLRIRSKNEWIASNTNKNINIGLSILRYLAKLLLGWISLLTIHSDNYGQAIHDKIGGSIVAFK